MKTSRYMAWSNALVRSAALSGIIAVVVGCHTPEHPTQHSAAASTSEHPSEHPSRTPAKAESKPNVTLDDVAAYIESYVKDNSADSGFHIAERAANKALSLKLDKVHRDRLSQVGPDLFFVCADFKTTDGEHTYDLDFFVQGASKDKLAVVEDKTSVHKEDGKARYTWTLNQNTGMWEQKPVAR